MAAMGTNLSHKDGTVSDRAIAYYAERAKGGAGLIITESSTVNPAGGHREQCIRAYDRSYLPGLRNLVKAVHNYGSAIALQLIHAGRIAESELAGVPPLAPSPIPKRPARCRLKTILRSVASSLVRIQPYWDRTVIKQQASQRVLHNDSKFRMPITL